MKLANAFSIGMLEFEHPYQETVGVAFSRVSLRALSERARLEGVESYVGHADTAQLLSNLLGVEVLANRASLKLNMSDELVVAQYCGPRLPEGATELPIGATIQFYQVSVCPVAGGWEAC